MMFAPALAAVAFMLDGPAIALPESRITPLAAALESPDQATRIKAYAEVEKSGSVPSPLLAPMLRYLRAEMAAGPPKLPAKGLLRLADAKVQPGDASIPKLKADAKDLVGKRFTMCVGVNISDRYSEGYRGFQDLHYSFDLADAVADGDIGHGYMSRGLGPTLKDAVVAARGEGAAGIIARIECTFVDYLYNQSNGRPQESIEILDWQPVGVSGPGEWAVGRLRKVAELLARSPGEGPRAVASVLCAEVDQLDADSEFCLRAVSAEVLKASSFDMPTRQALTKQLGDGLVAVQSSRIKRKQEVVKLIQGVLFPLERQALKDPKPKPKVDPASRAASLFKAAQNLEKAGKAKAAREFYRRIVTDFPGTPEAEKAKVKVGEPESKPQATRAPSPSLPSGLCGAPTKDGTPCMRRVAGGGYCYQHR